MTSSERLHGHHGLHGSGALPFAAAQVPMATVPIAAAASGAALSLMVSPIELVTIRMQMAGSPYTSTAHVLRSLLATEGVRGLTRGLGATIAREVPGSVAYFSVYEASKRFLRQALTPVPAPPSADAPLGTAGQVRA
ncbi:hypothetical protein FOA52_007519 [Chlamydomonas sp. UWO 241]|nr:hypothetical protein FOA52_007519 [Chlamydomonas sp. UWO 241]